MRLMSLPVYITLVAVIVVLLLSTTYVVNRTQEEVEPPVRGVEATEQALASWARDVFSHGLSPNRLESLLLLLISQSAERSDRGLSARGTSLTLEKIEGGRGLRGRSTSFELTLSYQREGGAVMIDAMAAPATETAPANAVGYALFVNSPEAHMVKLMLKREDGRVRWESQAGEHRSFRLSSEQVDRLARIVDALPPL